MKITCPNCKGTSSGKNPPCLLCNGKGWIDNEERCGSCIHWKTNSGECAPGETDCPEEGRCPVGCEHKNIF